MTAAYGFTDYRVQGQTLACVVVDIATLLSGGLNRPLAYAAVCPI